MAHGCEVVLVRRDIVQHIRGAQVQLGQLGERVGVFHIELAALPTPKKISKILPQTCLMFCHSVSLRPSLFPPSLSFLSLTSFPNKNRNKRK